jgi:hypothetical protein
VGTKYYAYESSTGHWQATRAMTSKKDRMLSLCQNICLVTLENVRLITKIETWYKKMYTCIYFTISIKFRSCITYMYVILFLLGIVSSCVSSNSYVWSLKQQPEHHEEHSTEHKDERLSSPHTCIKRLVPEYPKISLHV